MAEEALDKIESVAGWPHQPSRTGLLKIHGARSPIREDKLSVYGTDADHIRNLIIEQPQLGEYLSEKLGILKAQVIWAVRHEMARTVEDVLSRRVRALLLDARESIAMAPETARLMAIELEKPEVWQTEQVQAFRELAQGYILH
jgi:glycerol-3-phosphate dehydrogenase